VVTGAGGARRARCALELLNAVRALPAVSDTPAKSRLREDYVASTAHGWLLRCLWTSYSLHAKYPGKLLAYNCSPSFNWKKNLDDGTIAKFQRELAAMGYKFQFVTLAGFHALNYAMFELARKYKERGMAAYSELQQAELAAEANGYSATRHQREVGTGYFDQVAEVISGGRSTTLALEESTEAHQF
jgi:isocitrate lyase